MAGPRELIIKDAGGSFSDLDLLNLTGVMLASAPGGNYEADQVYLENPAVSDEATLPVILDVLGASGNATAVLRHDLNKRLRAARQYWVTRWRRSPLYVQARHAVEDNRRYAILKGADSAGEGDPWDLSYEANGTLEQVGVSLRREHPWRGDPPGVLPTVKTLTKVNGTVDKAEIHVTNLGSTGVGDAPTHLYHYDADAGPAWSSNLIAANDVDLLPATPAVGDRIYIGWDTRPGFHAVLPIGTAMVGSGLTWAIKASRSGTLQTLTYGTEATVFPDPGTSLVDLFEQAVEWFLSHAPGSTWEKQASGPGGAVTAYWIVLEITALASVTTKPKLHATEDVYGPKRNYIDVPASATAGDAPPRFLLRAKMPAGDGASPGIAGLSEIIAGALVDPGSFESVLNLHQYELPSGWAVAMGTDTTESNDARCPSGRRSVCTFATSTWASRVELTGTNKASAYKGTFHVYLIAAQSAGAAGDLESKLRVYLGGTTTKHPYVECQPKAPRAVAGGYEITDLGEMTFVPDTVGADSLTADLIFQVWSRRLSGASDLRYSRLVFIPVNHLSCRAWMDLALASLHLVGGSMLDLDFGVLFDRTMRYANIAGIYVPSGRWNRSATIRRFEPATQYRVYFLLGHYQTTFGTGPLFATAGAGIVVSVYMVNSYLSLRGNA